MLEVRKIYPNYLPQVGKTDSDIWGTPPIEIDTLRRTVADMINDASHYNNWEKELGTQGIALVLGNIWAETSWTKLVGKSGPKFDKVLERLRGVGLLEHAAKYAKLEGELVAYKVKAMLAEHGNQ